MNNGKSKGSGVLIVTLWLKFSFYHLLAVCGELFILSKPRFSFVQHEEVKWSRSVVSDSLRPHGL